MIRMLPVQVDWQADWQTMRDIWDGFKVDNREWPLFVALAVAFILTAFDDLRLRLRLWRRNRNDRKAGRWWRRVTGEDG
jgi:hypothetical protein